MMRWRILVCLIHLGVGSFSYAEETAVFPLPREQESISKWELPNNILFDDLVTRNPFALQSRFQTPSRNALNPTDESLHDHEVGVTLVGVIMTSQLPLAIVSIENHQLLMVKEGDTLPMSSLQVIRIDRDGVDLSSEADLATSIHLTFKEAD